MDWLTMAVTVSRNLGLTWKSFTSTLKAARVFCTSERLRCQRMGPRRPELGKRRVSVWPVRRAEEFVPHLSNPFCEPLRVLHESASINVLSRACRCTTYGAPWISM